MKNLKHQLRNIFKEIFKKYWVLNYSTFGINHFLLGIFIVIDKNIFPPILNHVG